VIDDADHVLSRLIEVEAVPAVADEHGTAAAVAAILRAGRRERVHHSFATLQEIGQVLDDPSVGRRT